MTRDEAERRRWDFFNSLLRIGAGATNELQLAGQVIAGILISQFALWNSPQESIRLLKVGGVAVMVGGAYMAVVP